MVMFREEGEGQATAAGTRGRGKGHVTVGMMVSAGWGGTVRSSTTCARTATSSGIGSLTAGRKRRKEVQAPDPRRAIILTTFSKKNNKVSTSLSFAEVSPGARQG